MMFLDINFELLMKLIIKENYFNLSFENFDIVKFLK